MEEAGGCDHNPSLPQELLQGQEDILNADCIGDTVFSKHWLFQCLLNVMKAVDEEESALEKEQAEDGKEMLEMIELEKDIEDEMCALWDMSANIDVAQLLCEYNAVDILVGVIEKTKAPRLVEIAVGILGNIACFPDLCKTIADNQAFVATTFSLMESSEAYILIQVVRLVRCLVVFGTERTMFSSDVLKSNLNFQRQLLYILQNSLNVELLQGTLHLLYHILDKEESFTSVWLDSEYLGAVIQAVKQLRLNGIYEALDEVWHIFHLLTQQTEEISVFMDFLQDMFSLVQEYLLRFDEPEGIVPSADKAPAIAAAISTLALLVASFSPVKELLVQDEQLVNCARKMLRGLSKKLSAMSRDATANPVNDHMDSSEDITDKMDTSAGDHQSCVNSSELWVLHDSLSTLFSVLVSQNDCRGAELPDIRSH